MDLQLETLLKDLLKSNMALQSFATIVSYDLQEPLIKVLDLSNKLKIKYGNKLDEQGLAYIESIESTSLKMKSLLETLYKYSTMTNQEIKFQEVRLGKIFDAVLDELKPKLEENHVQIQIVGNPPMIEADPMLISELFRSLICNAIRFRYPNISLSIRIEITTSRDLVKIEIEDDGVGFGSDDSEAIFKQFQKLNKVEEYNGIGIGLTFCKIICDKHQGSLSAKSAEGEGSTFTLILPLKQKTVSL